MPFLFSGKSNPVYRARKKKKTKRKILHAVVSVLAAWKVIRGWLPAEADQFIKFVDAKSITQYVRTDQLSTAMGGTVSKKEIDLIRTIDKTKMCSNLVFLALFFFFFSSLSLNDANRHACV